MSTLLFFITVIALIVLGVTILVKRIRHKAVKRPFKIFTFIATGYGLLWLVFYCNSSLRPIPEDTDICFDDWCASVTKIDTALFIGNGTGRIYPKGKFLIVGVKMSNEARGIAQKPSQPRVHVIDLHGNTWAFSNEGQQALEKVSGKQIPLDKRLELGQSLETEIVFDVPAKAKGLLVLVEEGPFITKLLLPEDRQVVPVL